MAECVISRAPGLEREDASTIERTRPARRVLSRTPERRHVPRCEGARQRATDSASRVARTAALFGHRECACPNRRRTVLLMRSADAGSWAGPYGIVRPRGGLAVKLSPQRVVGADRKNVQATGVGRRRRERLDRVGAKLLVRGPGAVRVALVPQRVVGTDYEDVTAAGPQRRDGECLDPVRSELRIASPAAADEPLVPHGVVGA